MQALRKAGCLVLSLAPIGKGVPDLLVSKAGRLVMFEVKNPRQPPSKRRLTPDQIEFHKEWCSAPIYLIETAEEALAVLG